MLDVTGSSLFLEWVVWIIIGNLHFALGCTKQDSELHRSRWLLVRVCNLLDLTELYLSQDFGGLKKTIQTTVQRVAHLNRWQRESSLALPPLEGHIWLEVVLLSAGLSGSASRGSSWETGRQIVEAVNTISSNQFRQDTVGLCGLF